MVKAAFVVDVPPVPAVHREYDFLDPRKDLFDEQQRKQDWVRARDLVGKVGTEFAEADSLVAFNRWKAHPKEFPEGANVVVFVGKTEEDGVWYVYRNDGRPFRYRAGLGLNVYGNDRVAGPRK